MRLFLLLAVFASSLTCSFAQVDLMNGLIGCYPFSGDANDLSPMANHGTVNGARLTADRFGNANSAYDFDGIDDFIEISPDNLQLNEFSYSLWVSPEDLPANSIAYFLISVGSDLGDQHILLGNQYTSGKHNSFAHGCYQGPGQNVRCTDEKIPVIGEWYHLALVKDAENYLLYVNGVLVCQNSVGNQSPFYGVGKVRATFGARNNYGQASSAKLDDIHLYNRPLTEGEVKALFLIEAEKEKTEELLVKNSVFCYDDEITFESPEATGADVEWSPSNLYVVSSLPKQITIKVPKNAPMNKITIQGVIPVGTECFQSPTIFLEKTISLSDCNEPEPETKLIIPSIFTPNSDQKNDTFIIYNWEAIPEFEILIYNRWGQVVFHSSGYSQPWDGTFKGNLVPSGVYTYKVLQNKHMERSGSITLVY